MYIHKTYACYIKKLYIKQLMRKCLQAAEDFEDMPELGFGDRRSVSSGFTARDASPDSVIFTADSNFSIFSSTSGSVERCSSASDVLDHDSLASQFSHHLAGHEYRESSSSGPDLDPNKVTTLVYKTGHVSRKEKVKVRKGDNSEAETEDENFFLDSARSSFSQALKECQDRRSRSEALLKNQDRRRPASLDLNGTVINVAHSSSPRFGVVKKTSVMARQTGIFPSPGTPNYRHADVGIQKGWSSERVPLHTNANRRHVNTALLPYNNGRALPSKWEDAERWIFSPVSGDGNMRHSFQQQQRRPKSKSGPLGPPGVAYYSMYSPAAPTLEGGNAGTIIANSPFSAGMMEADGLSITYAAHGGSGNLSGRPEPCMGRSISIHGYSELVSQSSLIGPQEEKVDVDGIRDAAANVSRAVSRRDMATQMSPEGSPCSSAGRRSSCSTSTPSILPIVELPSFLSSKSEVRDVQVDERVTITRWSKKNKALLQARGSGNVDDWKKKALEIRPTWEVPETAKSITKVKREEARITAWENLQKAKAEAAIRKLEMKLEKKRSSSMDKIMKKLRSAQKKAQEMRGSVLANQAHQVSGNSHKAISFRRTRQMGSLSGCFTCHAF